MPCKRAVSQLFWRGFIFCKFSKGHCPSSLRREFGLSFQWYVHNDILIPFCSNPHDEIKTLYDIWKNQMRKFFSFHFFYLWIMWVLYFIIYLECKLTALSKVSKLSKDLFFFLSRPRALDIISGLYNYWKSIVCTLKRSEMNLCFKWN